MSRFGPFPDPTLLLDHDEAEAAFATMLDGGGSDEQVAAFLSTLSDRGETMVEIAAAAQAMRDRLIPIEAPEGAIDVRSEEHTSELQSLMRISYAVFCLKKKQTKELSTNSEGGGTATQT